MANNIDKQILVNNWFMYIFKSASFLEL